MILGIDPGLTGALCWFDPATGSVETHDMPTFKRKHGKRTRTMIDAYALAILVDSRAARTTQAIIEEVGTMPGQGIASAFKFGYVAGMCEMVVAASLIPIIKVTPVQWKRKLKLGRDKSESIAMATRISPHHQQQWSRVKDDGRAEAFLLTQYWMREYHHGSERSASDGNDLDYRGAG